MSTNELSEEFLLILRSTDKLLPRLPDRTIGGWASLERERPRSWKTGDANISLRIFLCLTRDTVFKNISLRKPEEVE